MKAFIDKIRRRLQKSLLQYRALATIGRCGIWPVMYVGISRGRQPGPANQLVSTEVFYDRLRWFELNTFRNSLGKEFVIYENAA